MLFWFKYHITVSTPVSPYDKVFNWIEVDALIIAIVCFQDYTWYWLWMFSNLLLKCH